MTETQNSEDSPKETEPLEPPREIGDCASSPSKPKATETKKQKTKRLLDEWVWRRFLRTVDFLDAHSGAITAVATAVIAWLTISLSHDSRKQATSAQTQLSVMRGQLAEMRAEQRPWLRANFSPGDLKITKGKVVFGLKFQFINTGKNPALNPQVFPVLISGDGDQRAAHDHVCKVVEKFATFNKNPSIAFPNDPSPIVTYSLNADEAKMVVVTKDETWLAAAVLVCIAYKSGSQPGYHHTLYSFVIRRVDGKPIGPFDQQIPGSALILSRENIGRNTAD